LLPRSVLLGLVLAAGCSRTLPPSVEISPLQFDERGILVSPAPSIEVRHVAVVDPHGRELGLGFESGPELVAERAPRGSFPVRRLV